VYVHKEDRNGSFTEQEIARKVAQYFENRGFHISTQVKLRGRIPDILAIKDDRVIAIEIKGQAGNIEQGIEQALHQKNSVNGSYLVITRTRSNKKTSNICHDLGIGLLLIDEEGLEEVVKPDMNEKTLDSTQTSIFKEKGKPAKIKTEKGILVKLFRSESEVAILEEIIQNPNELHANAIARKTGLAPSTISKEMSIIFELGLVTKRQLGNLILYKIDTQCEIYNELKSIFQKLGGTKR